MRPDDRIKGQDDTPVGRSYQSQGEVIGFHEGGIPAKFRSSYAYESIQSAIPFMPESLISRSVESLWL